MRQHLDLFQHAMQNGCGRGDRTKKVNSHAVLQESLWFLRGETNVKPLDGDDFREDDFKLVDYKPHKGIKAPIAV